ncbi:MAG: peptidylprolyl isomerase fpr4 [Alectoria fallacina]|uniref:peptidylprolyl isomerase n=1 Tax=Alectoria fallacina TaxID=1903189 RepID=A0A8H3EGW9_9LECA|nr:MAG: peptidylprolyl isomerase fpr4 [Alectoria fallacina]
MAAIDPTATPEHAGTVNGDAKPRATLKLVYDANPGQDSDSDEGSDEEEEYLKALLAGRESEDEDEDEESSSDDDEKNGGPSDPSKTKKARKEAAMQQMMKALAETQKDSEDEMDVDESPKVNGLPKKSKTNKGKGKAVAEDLEDEPLGEDDAEDSMDGMEEVVVCTLDPEKNCQQTLDLTIGEDQTAYFKVSGTHTIYLTGNYVVPADNGHNHEHQLYDGEDEEDDYDMSPDEDELEDDEESDELDTLEDPRITEVASEDEDEPPKLVKKDEVAKKEEPAKKGKNKRAREESEDEKDVPASLDDIMAKSLKPEEPTTNGETKLSKKQLKKLKNNAGKAVEAAVENKEVKKEEKKVNKEDAAVKDSPLKGDKKVQFAKNLEQGPVSSPETPKTDNKDNAKPDLKKEEGKPKASLGVKIVQGVKIDDKKLGSGPAAKKGSKVGMRYIGKLKDGKVFDSNKKGKVFSFSIGDGSVIKGWDIGVAGMQAGGERRIVIPADLAYGKKGVAAIPGNSELTFDLKMLEVN